MQTTSLLNSGHGHVWKRPDGAVARCGGPSLCLVCRQQEQTLLQMTLDIQTTMTTPVLKIKKIHPEAKTPTYGTDGAACFDLYSVDALKIRAMDAGTVSTGLMVEVPPGWKMLVFSRSGHGFKHDVRLGNCVGVIDSDYRGELRIRVSNDGFKGYDIEVGERIAQAELVPAYRASFEEVDELSITERGEGAYGSTGR